MQQRVSLDLIATLCGSQRCNPSHFSSLSQSFRVLLPPPSPLPPPRPHLPPLVLMRSLQLVEYLPRLLFNLTRCLSYLHLQSCLCLGYSESLGPCESIRPDLFRCEADAIVIFLIDRPSDSFCPFQSAGVKESETERNRRLLDVRLSPGSKA